MVTGGGHMGTAQSALGSEDKALSHAGGQALNGLLVRHPVPCGCQHPRDLCAIPSVMVFIF